MSRCVPSVAQGAYTLAKPKLALYRVGASIYKVELGEGQPAQPTSCTRAKQPRWFTLRVLTGHQQEAVKAVRLDTVTSTARGEVVFLNLHIIIYHTNGLRARARRK